MTISLELAIELEEVGIEVESASVWIYAENFNTWNIAPSATWGDLDIVYPAPTFTEIWAVLPNMHPRKYFAFLYLAQPFPNISEVGYLQPEPWTLFNMQRASIPAEAAGQLLRWLKKEGLV